MRVKEEEEGSYIIVKITCRAAIFLEECCLACDGVSLLLMDPSLNPSSAISDREGLGYGSTMLLPQQPRSGAACGVVDAVSLCPTSMLVRVEASRMELSRSFASGSSTCEWWLRDGVTEEGLNCHLQCSERSGDLDTWVTGTCPGRVNVRQSTGSLGQYVS
jgi:hypothetical protein